MELLILLTAITALCVLGALVYIRRRRKPEPPPERWRTHVPTGRLRVNRRNLPWWHQHRSSEMGERALRNRTLAEIVELDRQMDDLREGRE